MPDHSHDDVQIVAQDPRTGAQAPTTASGDASSANGAVPSSGHIWQRAQELHHQVQQEQLQPQPSLPGGSSWSRCSSQQHQQLPAGSLPPQQHLSEQAVPKLADPNSWQQQLLLQQVQELQRQMQQQQQQFQELQRQVQQQGAPKSPLTVDGPPRPVPQQQQQQATPRPLQAPQPDPGFSRGPSTGSTTRQQQPGKKSLLNRLVEDGKQDVYAFTVGAIIDGGRGWRAWKPLLAMLFTFGLQMGLLVLLWDGLINGSKTLAGESDTDKLWRQVGQVQRQVCWLNAHAVKESPPAGRDADRFLEFAWPDSNRYSPDWCTVEMSYEQFKRCHNWLSNDTDKAACNRAVANLDSSLRAFGEGLLFPEGDFGYDVAWNLSDGGWVRPNGSPQTSSHQTCMLASRGKYGTDRDPAFVNLLAFLALVIYVHEEMRKAVMLAYVAAAHCGILPAFYQTDASRAATDCGRSLLWRAVMLVAPLLQTLTALMVLVSSLALSFTRETQASTVTIILSNVALSFIVDLDNRVGAMLASQRSVADLDGGGKVCGHANKMCRRVLQACHLSWLVTLLTRLAGADDHAGSSAAGPAVTPRRTKIADDDGDAGPAAAMRSMLSTSKLAAACGHAYMAVVGGLLLAEPVLLSPVFVFLLYWLSEQDSREQDSRASLEFEETSTDSAWAWFTTGMEGIYDNDEIAAMFLQIAYPVVVALIVILLFGRMLPVGAAKRWGPVLLALQVLLAVLSCVDIYGLQIFMVPCAWFASWLGMFVLWPLLHRSPRDCGGCACCCRSCGGCPLCRDSCPGMCCCSC